MIMPTNSLAALAELEIEKLPSLPYILVKMLEVCQDDNANFQKISTILAQDVTLTSRVLALANSPLYYSGSSVNSLGRALFVLGMDTLKTLIITVSVQQFFSNFGQQHVAYLKPFWRQSLSCALLSKSFAALTNFALPEQAYLTGLLHNVGSLVLQSQFPERYCNMLDAMADSDERSIMQAEQREFGVNHCNLGAELLAVWGLDPFTCDAVCYHHEPLTQVRDAHHLVKLVNLSAVLAKDEALGNNRSFLAADSLFGLTVPLTREIVLQIQTEVGRAAQSMGIDVSDIASESAKDIVVMKKLAEQIKNIGLLQNAKDNLAQSSSREELNIHITNTVELLFNVKAIFLFDINGDGNGLVYQCGHYYGKQTPDAADFKIPLEAKRSLIADSMLEKKVISSLSDKVPVSSLATVVDRQVISLSRNKGILCVPMLNPDTNAENYQGVMVLGIDEAYQESKLQLLSLFAAEASRAIEQCGKNALLKSGGGDAFKEEMENRLREIAHEANNPLSIIRNYLELLAIKLGDEHQATSELGIIREEIDRTGQIILQLRDLGKVELEVAGEVDINSELNDLVGIYKQSLFLTHGITCELTLDLELPILAINRNPIKQVFTNLIKNAAEAMDKGGLITLSSSDKINHNGHEYVEVVVADNGLGIPEVVRDNLFSAVVSSKGEGHSGLGLSICKRLIDELGGSISYRRSASKTEFKILLPREVKC
jgi:HD-like signal output (HDOD) protein/signal transduction histidine kinase